MTKQNLRIGLWLTGALAAMALVPAQARADFQVPNAAEVIKKVQKSVIRVQNIEIGEETGSAAKGLGGGSGFVFDVDYDKHIAYAMTNHHVSGNAMVNSVKFWDDAQYKAELVGRDPGIDVAILRILDIPDERDLPDSQKTIIPAVLGDSDRVKVGDYAVGMGSPGSRDAININRSDPYEDWLLHMVATDGVVTGRDTPIEFGLGIWAQNQKTLGMQYGTEFDYAFRITVPINPGNSGGPLFNAKGEVIGIDFYGGSFSIEQNYNHAIPINLAKDFATQLLSTGKFQKPWTGMDIVMPRNIKDDGSYIEFKEHYKAPDKALQVFSVRADSPAERAGLKQNDEILSVDDIQFKTAEQLRLYIFKQEIGKTLKVKVRRQGSSLKTPLYIEIEPKRGYDAEFSV